MKIGWLVWYDLHDKENSAVPEFWTQDPGEWRCSVQIVYTEVLES